MYGTELLKCDIVAFSNEFHTGRIYRVENNAFSILYMLQSMHVHTILYKGEKISVGDTVVSYSGNTIHEVVQFKIGFHGNMCYFANDAPNHEMCISNIINKS